MKNLIRTEDIGESCVAILSTAL